MAERLLASDIHSVGRPSAGRCREDAHDRLMDATNEQSATTKRPKEVQRDDWRALFDDASTRHGAFHLRRSPDAGLSPSTVRHRAWREQWEKPYPAVFYLPGSTEGWWRTASGRLELVGSDAALGLRSAAFAQGMLAQPSAKTEVIRADGMHRPRRPLLSVCTSVSLAEDDVEIVGGLRCTTAQRTMRDLSHVLDLDPLRAIGIDAVARDVLELGLLQEVVQDMRPGAPRRRLERVAEDLARVRTDSPFGYEILEAMAECGLDVEGEFPWRCPDGRIIHHDAAVPWAWVSVEAEGRGKYGTGNSYTTDRIRWTQASGQWRTVWVTWSRWQQQRGAVMADILRAVEGADRSAVPPQRADCRCRRCRRWAKAAALGVSVPWMLSGNGPDPG
jgi:hypothetical protein